MKGRPYRVTVTSKSGAVMTGDFHKFANADHCAWKYQASSVHTIAHTTVTDTRTGAVLVTYPKTVTPAE